jgi:hypothetical protein
VSGNNGVTAATLTLTDTGTVTQTQAITATNLLLLGAGGSYTLTNSSNSIATLAGSASTVNVNNGAAALTIDTVGGTNGLTTTAAGGITLSTNNASGITTTAITGNLNTSGAGPITLTANAVTLNGTLTATGQIVTIVPSTAATDMTLGASGGLSLSQAELDNITAATLAFGSTGSMGAMTVGGAVTLPSSITNLRLISGSSITVASGGSLNDSNASSNALLQGASLTLSGSISVNGAGSALALSTAGTATQSAAITATSLALLGSGGSYTLNDAGNLIGTLAVNTGSVSLTNGQALTIGTVAGTPGWTTTGNSTLTTTGGSSGITVANAVSSSGSALTLSAGGNVTINATIAGGTTGNITATANGNVTIGASGSVAGNTVALAATGAFINNRGSDAVSASNRWLVYSNAPDAPGENFGNLNSNNTAIWNNTYATLPPASVTLPGNRYIFAFAPGGTPATLTVTSLNDSKTYGNAANLSLYTVTGFQAGVPNAYLPDANVYSGTPAFSSAGAPAAANVGTYVIDISQGSLVASTGYNFAFVSTGLLTVNPTGLAVTANNATQTYNGSPYSGGNGVTYSGFVNGEGASVLSGTVIYGGTSQGAVNVGTYSIIPSNLISSNYLINYVGGTLTINKAPITVTANSQTKFIGSPDPPLTYSVTNGTLFGDDTLSGNLVRAPGEGLGPYPITQGTLASLNYDLTFVGSTLFIDANPAGTIAPSSSISATNTVPASSVSTSYTTALPSTAATGGLAVNTSQLPLKIGKSRSGKGIVLEPIAPPRP